MADTSYYEIVMTREQALLACSLYLKQRRTFEKDRRVKLIHDFMKKTTGVFYKRPKFKNIRECISYLKEHTDDMFSTYLWDNCIIAGSFWKNKVIELEKTLNATLQNEVRLHSEMTFLVTYLDK